MLQQSSLPMAAILGWAGAWRHSGVSSAWFGVAVGTIGLVVLSWPRAGQARRRICRVAFWGLPRARLLRWPSTPIVRRDKRLTPATRSIRPSAALLVAQMMQSVVLTSVLALTRPQALTLGVWIAEARRWRLGLFRVSRLGLLVRSLGIGAGCAGARRRV